jgi:hypothetical protein
VQGNTSVSDIVVPVYETLTGFSNVVVDQQNEGLVIPYFGNAGIPTSMYRVGLPSSLNSCDDTYAMPHADPTWAAHQNLYTFNTSRTEDSYGQGAMHRPYWRVYKAV